MYWYLSFLRPPPVSLSLPAEGITITPQVANDLRTELRDQPTDISYTWQRVYPSTTQTQLMPMPMPIPMPMTTPPQHLTTFCPPASTYRPVTVPLPRAARAGEKWRLGLFARPADGPSSVTILDLSAPAGPGVLGVWSEGIELLATTGDDDGAAAAATGAVRGLGGVDGNSSRTSRRQGQDDRKGKGKGKDKDYAPRAARDGPKQGRITREWTLPHAVGVGVGGGSMRLVEQTSFDLDKKVWDSGLALASWLWRYMDDEGDKRTGLHADARRVLDVLDTYAVRVVELGSGTGLVSIALAQILGIARPRAIEIVATDLDSAIELMRENIQLNQINAAASLPADVDADNDQGPSALVRADVLDWDAPLPGWIGRDTWPDIIVAADVTYNTSSFPALVSTLDRLLTGDEACPTRPRPLLLLAYKQRDAAERELWEMLAERGVGTVLVDVVAGGEADGQVEIWVAGRGVGV